MGEDNKNTSGHREGGYVPEEVANHFNWGAFLFSWIWGIGNNTKIVTGIGLVLLAIYLITGFKLMFLIDLPFAIWFGIKGNTWAWQNKEWGSIEKFHKVQRRWVIVWLIFLGIPALLLTILVMVPAIIGLIYLSIHPGIQGIQNKERPAVSKVIDIKKPSFNRVKLPPQTYEEWQKKYDPNYVPENKIKLPTPKPRAKKVPQTYEEWIKKNPENK